MLRVHTALSRDLSWAHSTTLDGPQPPETPAVGNAAPSLVCEGTTVACTHPHTETHNKHNRK